MGRAKKIGKVHPVTGVTIYDNGTCKARTFIGRSGYVQYRVRTYGKLGVFRCYKSYLLHRHVAELFIPNPENKPIVNHKDAKKDNPKASNLEWATYSENSFHAHRMGLNKRKLTRSDVLKIRRSKAPAHIICQDYNVAAQTIANVRKRISWKHVK